MLEKIKLLLGIAAEDMSQEDKLELLIGMAQEEATEYCHLIEYNEKLNPAVIAMVIEKYNRIGAEGLTSAASSGITESYIDGYSKAIYSLLNKHRRIRFV